jgi:hypothetical protein
MPRAKHALAKKIAVVTALKIEPITTEKITQMILTRHPAVSKGKK